MSPKQASQRKLKQEQEWVRETRFGRWFLGTHTWYRYVLSQAVLDFKHMLQGRLSPGGRILDAGCGQGLAFGLLEQHYKPAAIVGVDIDKAQIIKAAQIAKTMGTPTRALHGNAATYGFESESFDAVFCHQLLHHTGQQQQALAEFHRILKPGGLLLVGESCRSFINSVPVRLLFRHPHMVQQDADGYVALVQNAGFTVANSDVRSSRPWWSRRALGLAQKWGFNLAENPATEVLIIGTKPLNGVSA